MPPPEFGDKRRNERPPKRKNHYHIPESIDNTLDVTEYEESDVDIITRPAKRARRGEARAEGEQTLGVPVKPSTINPEPHATGTSPDAVPEDDIYEATPPPERASLLESPTPVKQNVRSAQASSLNEATSRDEAFPTRRFSANNDPSPSDPYIRNLQEPLSGRVPEANPATGNSPRPQGPPVQAFANQEGRYSHGEAEGSANAAQDDAREARKPPIRSSNDKPAAQPTRKTLDISLQWSDGEDDLSEDKLRKDKPDPKHIAKDTGTSSRSTKRGRKAAAPQGPGDDRSPSGSSSNTREKRGPEEGGGHESSENDSDSDSNSSGNGGSSSSSSDENDATNAQKRDRSTKTSLKQKPMSARKNSRSTRRIQKTSAAHVPRSRGNETTSSPNDHDSPNKSHRPTKTAMKRKASNLEKSSRPTKTRRKGLAPHEVEPDGSNNSSSSADAEPLGKRSRSSKPALKRKVAPAKKPLPPKKPSRQETGRNDRESSNGDGSSSEDINKPSDKRQPANSAPKRKASGPVDSCRPAKRSRKTPAVEKSDTGNNDHTSPAVEPKKSKGIWKSYGTGTPKKTKEEEIAEIEKAAIEQAKRASTAPGPEPPIRRSSRARSRAATQPPSPLPPQRKKAASTKTIASANRVTKRKKSATPAPRSAPKSRADSRATSVPARKTKNSNVKGKETTAQVPKPRPTGSRAGSKAADETAAPSSNTSALSKGNESQFRAPSQVPSCHITRSRAQSLVRSQADESTAGGEDTLQQITEEQEPEEEEHAQPHTLNRGTRYPIETSTRRHDGGTNNQRLVYPQYELEVGSRHGSEASIRPTIEAAEPSTVGHGRESSPGSDSLSDIPAEAFVDTPEEILADGTVEDENQSHQHGEDQADVNVSGNTGPDTLAGQTRASRAQGEGNQIRPLDTRRRPAFILQPREARRGSHFRRRSGGAPSAAAPPHGGHSELQRHQRLGEPQPKSHQSEELRGSGVEGDNEEAATGHARQAGRPGPEETSEGSPKITGINKPPIIEYTIFVCGSNVYGELGLGSEITEKRVPFLHEKLTKLKVVDFDCGANHCIALTAGGEVLTWGLGTDKYGFLGREKMDKEETEIKEKLDKAHENVKTVPQVVNWKAVVPGNITQVVATNDASFALTENGNVYGWGTFKRPNVDESYRIAGLGGNRPTVRSPMLLGGWKKINKLAGGGQHILGIDHDGRLLSMGNNRYGQLGVDRTVGSRSSPLSRRWCKPLPNGAEVAKIACGENSSYAIDKQGRLYTWGDNRLGQLGRSSVEPWSATPRLCKMISEGDEEVVAVDGGVAHSLSCTRTQDVYSWGQWRYQAHGLPRDGLDVGKIEYGRDEPRAIKSPYRIPYCDESVNVGAGRYHSVFMDKSGRAYTFGQSKDYQTGQGVNHFIEEGIDRVNTVIAEPEELPEGDISDFKVLRVAAGQGFTVFGCAPRQNESGGTRTEPLPETEADGKPKGKPKRATKPKGRR